MLADRRIRWSIAVVVGSAVSALVGLMGARARVDEPAGPLFAAFFVCVLPPVVALVATLLDPTDHPEAREDSIEAQWRTRAASQAFFDTVIAMALAQVVTAVLDVSGVPSTWFFALAMVDFTTRLIALHHREG